MNSRLEFPDMLKRVYAYRKERCDGAWNIDNTEQLEKLLDDSEREFYFFLTYAYMSNLDLTGIITNESLPIRLAVAIYTSQAKEQGYGSICEYLDQFIVADESVVQAKKVIHEITMAKQRERIENDRKLLD